DFLLGGLLAYHELVGRGARCVFARVHHERSQVRETALGTENALLIECRRRQIPVGTPQIHQPMVGEAVGTGQLPCLFDRGRLHVEVDVHCQSLTSLRSPRYSSLAEFGSSAHLMRSRPSVTSRMVPQ